VLRFEDSQAVGAFGDEHVDAIVGFGARVQAHAGARLIVHCHHGQSRSPAALFVLLAVALGPGREAEAFARPWPNRRLILVADARLARAGALVRELDGYRERFQPG
jgi:predicted protein tyrosine phosphatase